MSRAWPDLCLGPSHSPSDLTRSPAAQVPTQRMKNTCISELAHKGCFQEPLIKRSQLKVKIKALRLKSGQNFTRVWANFSWSLILRIFNGSSCSDLLLAAHLQSTDTSCKAHSNTVAAQLSHEHPPFQGNRMPEASLNDPLIRNMFKQLRNRWGTSRMLVKLGSAMRGSLINLASL